MVHGLVGWCRASLHKAVASSLPGALGSSPHSFFCCSVSFSHSFCSLTWSRVYFRFSPLRTFCREPVVLFSILVR